MLYTAFSVLSALALVNAAPLDSDAVFKRSERRAGVYHLPFVGPAERRRLAKRTGATLPVGSWRDAVYSIALQIGGQTQLVQVDLGSADQWNISPDCGPVCTNATDEQLPRYDPSKSSTFRNLSTPLTNFYGSGQSVNGTLGLDTITIGGVDLPDSPIDVVYSTDQVLTTQNVTSGLLGAGFPLNSQIFQKAIAGNFSSATPQAAEVYQAYLNVLPTYSPPLIRMYLQNKLDQPVAVFSYQRTGYSQAFAETSNAGALSIGGYPSGLSEADFNWYPVALVPASVLGRLINNNAQLQGQSPPLSDTVLQDLQTNYPSIPQQWTVLADGIVWNGTLITDWNRNSSTSLAPAIQSFGGFQTLFDTGGTLMQFAPDDYNQLMQVYGPFSLQQNCETPIDLQMRINGTDYPIDPADLLGVNKIADSGAPDQGGGCSLLFANASLPNVFQRNSMTYGDAMFRSNIVAVHWGNVLNPSADPPRVGLISTVNRQQALQRFNSTVNDPNASLVVSTSTAAYATTNVPNPIWTGVTASGASQVTGGFANAVASPTSGPSPTGTQAAGSQSSGAPAAASTGKNGAASLTASGSALTLVTLITVLLSNLV